MVQTTGFAPAELPGYEASTNTVSASSGELSYENLIIHAVKLEGLHNTRESKVRSQLKIRPGEIFDPVEAKSDLKRLMGLGAFSSGDVTTSTVQVKGKTYLQVEFMLQEKPKIRKVFILGTKAVGKGTIKDILSPASADKSPEHRGQADFSTDIESGAYMDETKLLEAMALIEAKYEEKAVFGTTAAYEIKEIPDHKVEVTIKITEGKRGRIASVVLDGFNSYPSKRVKKAVKVKPGKVYNIKKIQKGLLKLNELYKEDGWLDFQVRVSSRVMEMAEVEKGVKIKKTEMPVQMIYRGAEGRRHFLLSYRFDGNENITTQELHKLANLPVDKILQESRLREAQNNILDAYRNIGYLFASIELEKIWEEGGENPGLQLIFHIQERQKVYIGSIYIEGLGKTKEYVIKREILLKEGDLFRSKKLYRSQEKIFNLGFIEDIQMDYEATPNPNYVDLIFDVKEGRPGMLTAGAGFSSIDGIVGQVSVQHLNVLGRAQRLGVSTEFGKRRQSYDVSWTTPWTWNRPMSTTLTLFNTDRSLQFASNATGFKRKSQGGSVFVAPRFEEDTWILGFGYTLQQDRITNVLDIYKDQIPETKTTRSSVETRVTYDSRDYYLDPKKGLEQTVSNVFTGGPLGGDVYIVKPTGKHAFHIPTFTLGARHTFVLSSSLRWGLVAPYGQHRDVPVSDRFFVGGAETVRGYTYTGEIGPISGGRTYTVGNIEYKIPLLMERRLTIIQFATFLDFGGAWSRSNDVNLNFGRGENKLKAGVGFGIRFKTPAFPIRLDWGWGLHHRPGEAINQFYFTIGSIL